LLASLGPKQQRELQLKLQRGSADCVGIYLAPEDEDENNGEDDYDLDKHVMMEKSIQ
jgi:hypothetical protein